MRAKVKAEGVLQEDLTRVPPPYHQLLTEVLERLDLTGLEVMAPADNEPPARQRRGRKRNGRHSQTSSYDKVLVD
jgi:hypothetical protein